MEIKFTSGDPVSVPRKVNVFEMELTCMSGDADHYETNVFSYDKASQYNTYEMFKNRVALTVAAFAVGGGDYLERADFITRIKEAADALNIDWDAGDFISDTIGYEVMSDGQFYASPQTMKLFYYDMKGVKHKATVEINGHIYGELSHYRQPYRFWVTD